MLLRWRITIKIWDKDRRPLCDRDKPVYECNQWSDTEPDWSEVHNLLEAKMNEPRFQPDNFYGEATRQQVMHTNRSRFVPA
jgi:hypothetical protein